MKGLSRCGERPFFLLARFTTWDSCTRRVRVFAGARSSTMFEFPMIRRFGGPEAVLIAVALAFAVSMTAWWHGLYQGQGDPRPLSRSTVQLPDIGSADDVDQVTIVAYLVNTSATELLPGVGIATSNGPVFSQTDRSDPNQTLLLVIAVIGAVATAVYCLSIYPALRRLH